MRPIAVVASAAIVASALVGVPFGAAQAAGPDFTASWDGSTKQFRLVAAAGIAPFGESEELVVSGADEVVTVALVDATHSIAPGTGCAYHPELADGVLCTSPLSSDRTRMTIDLRAATGATTTAVAPASASADQLAITLYGGSGPDYVQGGVADDEIDGGLGDDDLFGGAGNDKISGGDGADNIDGEEGNDSVGGGPGNDYVNGDTGLDSITGGPGVDELDSEDGQPDTYVNCDNAPGEGKITFDRDLDIPRDCPVILPPTAPRNLEAAGGKDSITVSWAPPNFDGNAPDFRYELYYRPPGSVKYVDAPILIDNTETSFTMGNLGTKPGLYLVTLRAVNSAGEGPSTAGVPVAVGGAPSPPQSVKSAFEKRWVAKVMWTPPVGATDVSYELALRVKDRKHKSWLAWSTLPDKVSGTSLDVGDDLRLVGGRMYQFRVRTVTAKGEASNWTNSPARFAGDLAPLQDATMKTASGDILASVTAPGMAWKHNVELQYLTATYKSSSYSLITMVVVNVAGDRYSWTFPGPKELTGGCSVGIMYYFPGGTSLKAAQAASKCP